MNSPQVDRSPTPKRYRAGQEARPRELEGEPVPEALRVPGQRMEEVSQAVVLRVDGQTKIAPSPQILRGNAVEECVCRVLRESPL